MNLNHDDLIRAELVELSKRADGPTWVSAWRARERWDTRWFKTVTEFLTKRQTQKSTAAIAKAAREAWGVGFLRRATTDPASQHVVDTIHDELNEDNFRKGGMSAYLGIALDEGSDAAQFSLDALGIDCTFAWTSVRDLKSDPFAVRGSKIIQGIYGTHVDRLAKLAVAAANPEQPQTISDLTKRIRSEWPRLSAQQARVIARTESASVWETTNYNTMRLNGVESFDWLLATGPAIGNTVHPVCPECLRRAAVSPYTRDELSVIPPAHPQCRCTLIQHVDPNWLPPSEPWCGGPASLEIFT